MSIFVDKNTRLVVQGITGKEGQFHARQCIDYGTNVVAGVTPGKGGQEVDGIPVFEKIFVRSVISVVLTLWALRRVGAAAREAVWEIPLPIVVLGGIYSGYFAISEAAAVTALYVLIVDVLILREVPLLAGCHHETMDGKGYPKRLTSAEMPLAARMMVLPVSMPPVPALPISATRSAAPAFR